MYSSYTLLLTGAVFITLGLSVTFMKRMGFVYSYFEIFLFSFSFIFFIVLAVSSPAMRKRIIRSISSRLYTRKYDYYQQFFRLNSTNLSGNDMRLSITRLIQYLKETLTVDDIYVFILDNQDGNFHIHHNPEIKTRTDIFFHSNNIIINFLINTLKPVDFYKSNNKLFQYMATDIKDSIIDELDISTIFPVLYENRLTGLLALKKTKDIILDEEDVKLISSFARSIGNIIFQHQILKDRIEQKQFESFNHISSFIIHDIKNQVATLKLLINNAKSNINNPEFQKSLLMSLNNCSTDLQNLIDKFTSPPKEESIILKDAIVDNIIEEVISTLHINSNPDIRIKFDLNSEIPVLIDKISFRYILINLFTNALDAMENRGVIKIYTNDIYRISEEIILKNNINTDFLNNKKVFIMISDSGKGMTEDFITNKLFHPFSSTKDKGIGIGLYQCKILIEKMGGKILCKSEINKGTSFIILI